MSDRDAEALADRRSGWFRRLDLIHDGRTFLRRRGIDLRLFGIYLHRIDQPDPGLDLHDHPWPFVSIVLRGGYTEEVASTRVASEIARHVEAVEAEHPHGSFRRGSHIYTWGRWSVHRVPLTRAHRITHTEPGTVTLVIRGRKSQPWGFYLPDGWHDQRSYDYEARRPCSEVRS